MRKSPARSSHLTFVIAENHKLEGLKIRTRHKNFFAANSSRVPTAHFHTLAAGITSSSPHNMAHFNQRQDPILGANTWVPLEQFGDVLTANNASIIPGRPIEMGLNQAESNRKLCVPVRHADNSIKYYTATQPVQVPAFTNDHIKVCLKPSFPKNVYEDTCSLDEAVVSMYPNIKGIYDDVKGVVIYRFPDGTQRRHVATSFMRKDKSGTYVQVSKFDIEKNIEKPKPKYSLFA